MVGVTFTVRRRGARVKILAEGLGALNNIGEIYLENPRLQMMKIRRIKSYGHTDPMKLPPHVTKWARAYIKKAIRETTELIRDWLKNRLITGGLGRQSPVTRKIKLWLLARGRISPRYGRPPPLGIRRGGLLRSIKSRVRKGSS